MRLNELQVCERVTDAVGNFESSAESGDGFGHDVLQLIQRVLLASTRKAARSEVKG